MSDLLFYTVQTDREILDCELLKWDLLAYRPKNRSNRRKSAAFSNRKFFCKFLRRHHQKMGHGRKMSQTCLSQEKVSVNFSRLPHPLVRIFEPALPFKPSMLEKDSNSQLQLQVSRWSWIANKAPQLATLKFTLCSHFLTLCTQKISRNGCFVAACTTQTHALTRDCSGAM